MVESGFEFNGTRLSKISFTNFLNLGFNLIA